MSVIHPVPNYGPEKSDFTAYMHNRTKLILKFIEAYKSAINSDSNTESIIQSFINKRKGIDRNTLQTQINHIVKKTSIRDD